MPRLPALTNDNAPAAAQDLLAAMEKKYGTVPSIFRVMANHPPLLQACADWDAAISKDLPARYRELAYLKSSLDNGCAYCSHYHKQGAAKAGVAEQAIGDVENFESSTELDAKDKAVLRFADVLTRQAQAPAELVEELKGFLTPAQLVALVGSIGLANFTNRFKPRLRYSASLAASLSTSSRRDCCRLEVLQCPSTRTATALLDQRIVALSNKTRSPIAKSSAAPHNTSVAKSGPTRSTCACG